MPDHQNTKHPHTLFPPVQHGRGAKEKPPECATGSQGGSRQQRPFSGGMETSQVGWKLSHKDRHGIFTLYLKSQDTVGGANLGVGVKEATATSSTEP